MARAMIEENFGKSAAVVVSGAEEQNYAVHERAYFRRAFSSDSKTAELARNEIREFIVKTVRID